MALQKSKFDKKYVFITLIFAQDEYVVDVIKPQIGLEELSKILEPVLLEYYDTGITEEVAVSINVQRTHHCLSLL